MTNNNEWAKVLIPMIRKVMPAVIAQDIVGVQPMNIPPKYFTYKVIDRKDIDIFIPENHQVVFVNAEVGIWIQKQPVHLWKYIDLNRDGDEWDIRTHYVVSDELLTLLALKWA